MEVSGQPHATAALTPGKNPGTHWIGSQVSPKGRSDSFGEKKNLLPQSGYEPLIVHPQPSP